MLFKNALTYRILTPITLTDDDLLSRKFVDIRPEQIETGGFSEVSDDHMTVYVNYCQFMQYRHDEKIIPPKSVKRVVALRAAELRKQGLNPGKEELEELKNQVILEHLPHAMVKTTIITCYIDHQEQHLIVNAGHTQAEKAISVIREILGSFKVVPLVVMDNVSKLMTTSIKSVEDSVCVFAPFFTIGNECQGATPHDEKMVFKNIDLPDPDVADVITDKNLTLTDLQLISQGGIRFTLGFDMGLRKLKYSEEFKTDVANYEPTDSESENGLILFASQAFIMTSELRTIIKELISLFGGVDDLEDGF